MTPTESIIAKIDQKISDLVGLRALVCGAEGEINAAASDHSGIGTSAETLYIHLGNGLPFATEAAKALARALPGRWEKERNSGAIDYRGVLLDSPHPVCIFAAEPLPASEALSLEPS